MYKYRRHPLVIPMGVFRSIWAALLPILFSVGQGIWQQDITSLLIGFGVLLAMIVLLSIYEFLKWRSFTYEWDENEIRMMSGIWTKTKTLVPTAAITGVDHSANPIMKAFNLATLKLETAAGGKTADVELSYIPEEFAAHWLKEEDKPKVAYRFTLGQLLLYGSASPATLVSIGAIMGLLADVWTPDDISSNQKWWEQQLWVWIPLALGFFITLWLAASLIVAAKYFGFALERKDDVLTITKGLWKRQTTRIHVAQIQGFTLVQHPLHSLLGYTSIQAFLTSSKGEDGSFDNVLFPLLRKTEVTAWLAHYLPEYTLPTAAIHLPKRLQMAYIWRNLLFVSWMPLFAFWKLWLLYIAIPLMLISVILGYFQGKAAAWELSHAYIAFTTRRVAKWLTVIPANRIQCMKVLSNPIERRNRCSTVYVHHVSGSIGHTSDLSYVPEAAANEIIAWYESIRKR